MGLDTETMVNILTTSKKVGERDYFKEYEITPAIVRCILIESGFPTDKQVELKKSSIDLTAVAIFKHRVGSGQKNLNLCDCFSQVIGRNDGEPFNMTGCGTITDLAWNQTVDEIISLLEKQ